MAPADDAQRVALAQGGAQRAVRERPARPCADDIEPGEQRGVGLQRLCVCADVRGQLCQDAGDFSLFCRFKRAQAVVRLDRGQRFDVDGRPRRRFVMHDTRELHGELFAHGHDVTPGANGDDGLREHLGGARLARDRGAAIADLVMQHALLPADACRAPPRRRRRRGPRADRGVDAAHQVDGVLPLESSVGPRGAANASAGCSFALDGRAATFGRRCAARAPPRRSRADRRRTASRLCAPARSSSVTSSAPPNAMSPPAWTKAIASSTSSCSSSPAFARRAGASVAAARLPGSQVVLARDLRDDVFEFECGEVACASAKALLEHRAHHLRHWPCRGSRSSPGRR